MEPNEKLERTRLWASIASSVAIPVVLAVIGFTVQRQLSDDGLRKDYVVMAAGILREKPDSQPPELRAWAVAVLSRFSPVPFSTTIEHAFFKGPIPALPPEARQEGPPDICIPSCVEGLRRKQMEDLEAINRTLREIKGE